MSVERDAEAFELRVMGEPDARRAARSRRAGGEDEQRVAGGGVAVDGDGVERLIDAGIEASAERRGLDRGVGEQEGEHGRHVRRDHARALGDAVDRDLHPADLRLPRRELRIGVGGHDGARGVEKIVFPSPRREIAEQARELAHLERLADHPGRGEIHVGLEAPRGVGRRFRRELDRLASALAGEGVGIAGIDHERAGEPMSEARPAPFDGRRRGLGLGERAGDRGAGVEQREQEVGPAGIADAGRASGEPNALDAWQAGKLFGRKGRKRGHGFCLDALKRSG